MPDKLSHVVVKRILSGRIRDFAAKRGIEPNVPTHINVAFDIGIIILSGLILFVKSLPQSSFQESREQKDEEIENTLLIEIMFQVKKVDGEHLLQHIMKEVIALVLRKAGANA